MKKGEVEMNATAAGRLGKIPTWFRVVAVAGLLWELFGVAMYLMHVGILPNDTSQMSEAERSLMASSPTFVTALFAIGVFAGAIGALGLVMRRRWARPVLIVSLVAVVLQFGSWLLLTDAIAVVGPTVFVMPLIIVLVALALVWLAGMAGQRGWLD